MAGKIYIRIPTLVKPAGRCGILTQDGGHNHRMAATGGGVSDKMSGNNSNCSGLKQKL